MSATVALIGLVWGILIYRWWRWRIPEDQISPGHSEEYDAVAEGRAAPTPFRFRWLLPRILGTSVDHWQRANAIAMVLSVPCMGLLARAWDLDFWPSLTVMAAWGFFPSYWERALHFPKSMEPINMVFVIGALGAGLSGHLWLAVILSLLAGATREISPLIVAAGCWSAWPLVGLLAMGWWRPRCEPWRQKHLHGSPWKLFRLHGYQKIQAGIPFDWLPKIGPGILGLATLDPRVWLSVGLATGTMLVASDKIRLLAAASPLLMVSAVSLIPLVGLPLFVILALACANQWESC